MADPIATALSEMITANWHWIAITIGSGLTAGSAFTYRVCTSLKDWIKPKLENIYAKHMELVGNLNLLLPDMADRMKKIEECQTESGKKLADVHRLMTADEEWDEESKKEKHVNK